jgi:tRNA G46 methylase TrmB
MFERKQEQHQDMEKYYKEDIDHIPEKAEKSMMRYRSFLKRLKTLDIKGRYLEIGSGLGILTAFIAQREPDIEITALEVSKAMTKAAKKIAGSKKNHSKSDLWRAMLKMKKQLVV